ncbi:hypothetical protein [Planctomyces sp. SH-PL14]|uniref:hypothetical protein n=1 Tax=Planctomyces sp. SH-PL14 TaxID=1632864 RepID=UPI00078CD8E0|nr:hypothetical protein [Planctomyces sp. SH-PL14]AMV22478.1 hypothetical protein VT03_31575 [Planctomyces sp. SH-PL14]
MRSYDILGFLFLLSLFADLLALCVVVSKAFGSVNAPWPVCLFGAMLTWGISLFLLWSLGVELQNAA